MPHCQRVYLSMVTVSICRAYLAAPTSSCCFIRLADLALFIAAFLLRFRHVSRLWLIFSKSWRHGVSASLAFPGFRGTRFVFVLHRLLYRLE